MPQAAWKPQVEIAQWKHQLCPTPYPASAYQTCVFVWVSILKVLNFAGIDSTPRALLSNHQLSTNTPLLPCSLLNLPFVPQIKHVERI